MQHVGARHRLEQLTGHVDRGAVAAGRHVEFAGVGLGVGDEVGHAGDAQCPGFVGVHHHHIGHPGHQRDGGEVLHRVKRQLVVQRLVDAVGTHGAHQQRVAVGGGLGNDVGANVAACTGTVVHDKRLAKSLGQLIGHHAGQDVGGAAGREGHHDLHRFGGPGGLRQGRQRGRYQYGSGAGQQGAAGEGYRESFQWVLLGAGVSIRVWTRL